MHAAWVAPRYPVPITVSRSVTSPPVAAVNFVVLGADGVTKRVEYITHGRCARFHDARSDAQHSADPPTFQASVAMVGLVNR
jgi:hypothetical protein